MKRSEEKRRQALLAKRPKLTPMERIELARLERLFDLDNGFRIVLVKDQAEGMAATINTGYAKDDRFLVFQPEVRYDDVS